MKYDLFFEIEPKENDGWGSSSKKLDTWIKESTVPSVGDSVFMSKGGWRIVSNVSFSSVQKNGRRMVLISLKRLPKE